MNPRSSFTLIEFLIVIAIVAVLSVVVILTLNPAQLLKQARDSTRLSDLAIINKALNIYQVDQVSGNLGSSSVVYVSIPDPAATTTAGTNCQGVSGLTTSSLPSGWSWHCPASSTARNTDGTGWIPVNFSSISAGSPLSNIPIDPVNTTSSGYYYAYTVGSSSASVWLLSALPESTKYRSTQNPLNLDGVFLSGADYTISPIFTTQGLVGWWKFDEGSGSSASDSSGNGNTGTVVGASWAGGKTGQGLSFDGTNNDRVSVSSTVLNDMSSFSWSFWIVRNDLASTNIMSKDAWNCGVAGMQIAFYWQDPNVLDFRVNHSSGAAIARSQSYAASVWNNWRHIVAVYDGILKRVSIYKDGVEALYSGRSDGVGAKSNDNSYNLLLGDCGNAGQGTDFAGFLDDVRIYNRALSAAEIQAIYNATK